MRLLIVLFSLVLSASAASAQGDTEADNYEQDAQSDGEGDATVDYNDAGEEPSGQTHYTVSPEQVSEANGYHNERIDVKRFDKKKWEEVVAGQDYSEIQKKKKKKTDQSESSSDDSRSNQRSDKDEEDDEEDDSGFSFSAPIGSPIVTIVFYAIVAGVIGYILFLIIKNASGKSNVKLKKDDQQNPSAVVDDIKELEIDRLLREALSSANYRLAIRIYFLGILQKLDEDGIILWKRDKTNRDYLTELFKKSYHFEDIRNVTLLYEEVWYGDHNFSVESYQEIITSFKAVSQKINVAPAIEN